MLVLKDHQRTQSLYDCGQGRWDFVVVSSSESRTQKGERGRNVQLLPSLVLICLFDSSLCLSWRCPPCDARWPRQGTFKERGRYDCCDHNHNNNRPERRRQNDWLQHTFYI